MAIFGDKFYIKKKLDLAKNKRFSNGFHHFTQKDPCITLGKIYFGKFFISRFLFASAGRQETDFLFSVALGILGSVKKFSGQDS